MTLAIMNLGPIEIIIIVGLGLLIFGKRLPEVGRSLGKGIVEFKKGLAGIEDEVKGAGKTSNTAKKIDPPAQSVNMASDQQKTPTNTENDSNT